MKQHKPVVLVILDGWGYSPTLEYNAIASANTPNWDRWWRECPHTLLEASGGDVGLPSGQMGNSEVGHMHIGAGRVIDQDLTRIDKSIATGEFFQNPTLLAAFADAKHANRRCHLIGLLSPGGVHSHERHFIAMIEFARQQAIPALAVHAFLDGRDTPPRSALSSLEKIDQQLKSTKLGRVASIIGRYFAMDRDHRWDRIQKAYDLLTLGKCDYQYPDPKTAIEQAYERGESDEFFASTLIGDPNLLIEDGDTVIFMNFRADRSRQLSHALINSDFTGFQRQKTVKPQHFITLTDYADYQLKTEVAFPPQIIRESVGEVIAEHGLTQLRIAESEKYAHVTYFLNCGREKEFVNEERILIPSPKIATYDLKPEMSAEEVSAKIVAAIEGQTIDVIIANFANADMVGHSGHFAATVKAIDCLDQCLGEIAAALKKVGGELMITADHGNAERMFDPETHQSHTAHTSGPVPFLYIGRPAIVRTEMGSLIDIAPTLLTVLGLPIPSAMTGHSLLNLK